MHDVDCKRQLSFVELISKCRKEQQNFFASLSNTYPNFAITPPQTNWISLFQGCSMCTAHKLHLKPSIWQRTKLTWRMLILSIPEDLVSSYIPHCKVIALTSPFAQ